jgi:deaminated glutathione amidase
VLGTHDDYVAGAETLEGPTIGWAREAARELGIDLVAGSIVERREGREKLSNTSVHVGPDGEIKGVYRKIHMFDVVVGGIEYKESASEEPGEEIAVTELANGERLGLTVCYDLRFPELFRILAIRGARVITLPAAFTKVTGQAHWEILIRARAIENQAFLVAADQVGIHPEDKESFGGSMIVDPWGEVLARAERDEPCVVTADLDSARQDEVREKLPSLANRVPGAYAWPQEVSV